MIACIQREYAKVFAEAMEPVLKKMVQGFESRIKVEEKFVHIVFFRRFNGSVGGYAQVMVEEQLRPIRQSVEASGWRVNTRVKDDTLYIIFSYPIC